MPSNIEARYEETQAKVGGQAIVMVSLALFSMAGMMGLAVDLGWSYFIQKEAQASADGAALAAVHEAWSRLGGSMGSAACGNSSASNLWCSKTAPGVACGNGNASGASNLYAGCLYAINNGFNYATNARMKVWMQADVGSSSQPVTPTGASLNIASANIVYWVTVRTVTTIPQLFSSLLGNTQGTVAALGTAAVAAQTTPGSFIGLNREGDCLTYSGSRTECGADITISSSGNSTCYNNDNTSAGVTAKVCAPAGVYLASQCNGSSTVGCNTPTGTNGYAGNTTNNPTVWAGPGGTHVRLAGTVNNPSNFTPTAPTNGTDSNMYQDPTRAKAQPPIASSSLQTCGILGGDLSGNLGPYQYYAYTTTNSVTHLPVPNGNPLKIGNNTTVTFDTGNGCPGVVGGSGTSSGTFGTYIFYGGLNMNGNNNTTTTFGAGQFVMAGTNSQTGSVMSADGGTITGNSVQGTEFIFTNGSYSGALDSLRATLPAGLPTLYQGNIDIKNTNITLSGLTSSAPTDPTYKDILFWQDRENSTDTLNLADGSLNTSVAQGTPCSGCGFTNTSPALILEDGNGAMNLTGVSYQPRGAWIQLQAGTAGVFTSHLQFVTGALVTPVGSGSSSITLLGPSNPVIIYVTSLVQ